MQTPIATAEAGSPETDRQMNTTMEFMVRVAERFGLPVVILCLVLWWARNDIVQPLLDAHFQMIRQIADGQRQHTAQLDNLGRKLDELIIISSSVQKSWQGAAAD